MGISCVERDWLFLRSTDCLVPVGQHLGRWPCYYQLEHQCGDLSGFLPVPLLPLYRLNLSICPLQTWTITCRALVFTCSGQKCTVAAIIAFGKIFGQAVEYTGLRCTVKSIHSTNLHLRSTCSGTHPTRKQFVFLVILDLEINPEVSTVPPAQNDGRKQAQQHRRGERTV